MKRIYLDNAATTAMDPKVIEAMNKGFAYFGNPSSIHTPGQEARRVIDNARETIANFLNCKPGEVIFTSGGSEADNLAIRGVIDAWYSKSEIRNPKSETNSNHQNLKSETSSQATSYQLPATIVKPHVITSAIEHHAVLHTIQDLEKGGKIEATYIKPGKNGIVRVEDVEAAIRPNTVLVSIMYVNNEVGTVQPIRQIGYLLKARNKSQKTVISTEVEKSSNKRSLDYARDDNEYEKIFFHCDAVQATEFCEMDTEILGVDLLSISAHKIHGPKGIGALFVKKGTPIVPQITGGDHEFRLRAGTENVAGIAGFAEAIRQVSRNSSVISTEVEKSSNKRSLGYARDDVKRLRNKLEDTILKNIPETYLNGDKEERAPHISNISFKNAEGEAIILNLDFLGIAVSSGSACTARSLEPSHVLTAMEVPHVLSHGAIRFSLSRETTEEEIDIVLRELPPIIAKLREMSPFN